MISLSVSAFNSSFPWKKMERKRNTSPRRSPPASKATTVGGVARSKRRRGTREGTRQRLVDAAIAIIRREGIDGLTTVKVTQAAGIVQSGFYMHFANIGDLKRAAAEQVASEVADFVAEHRRAGQDTRGDTNSVVEHYQQVLKLFLFERRFAEMLIRFRHDPSPLGTVLRELLSRIRKDLIADLHRQVQELQGAAPDDARIKIYADILLGMVMALGEALLEGRFEDPELLARELTISSIAIATAAMEH